jgi:hypothetical protein
MPTLTLPVEVHFHDPDWKIILTIAAAVLAFVSPEVALRGVILLSVVLVGLVAVTLAESRPVRPCTTQVLPPAQMM